MHSLNILYATEVQENGGSVYAALLRNCFAENVESLLTPREGAVKSKKAF